MQAPKRSWALLATLFAIIATPVRAVPPARVDAVQMPAWLERNGQTHPLAAGMELKSGDRIRTGAGARAYVTLAEGSTVKLGEDARFALFTRSLKPQTVFKGALDVAAGAFRFTTDRLRRIKARDVSIRVGTATAGIRGTDLWGRSTAQQDLVCLIDGQIEIKHAALIEPVTMREPMTFFVAPRGAAPQPVAAVDPAEFARWARETEITPGDGAAHRDGKWKLQLGRHGNEAEALEQYDAARNAGYAVRITPEATPGGGWNYVVELAGFRSEADATQAAARLKAAADIAATPVR